MNELRLVDDNLRAAMGFFAGATGSGHVESFDFSFAIHSGLDYGVFNIALLTQPVKPGPRGLEGQLVDCARFYRSRSSRWSFWLCEEYLDSRTRRQCKQIFQAANLREISRAPAMIASGLSPAERKLPALECTPVTDAASRAAFGELTAVCFDIPFPITKSVYLPERAWQGVYKGFVGWVDGKPVSMIATVVCSGAIGIYSLGTLPAYRNRGYGEALLRAAVRKCPPGLPLVLESTAAGYQLYRRLGFREVGKFTVYLTK
jgi:ribosomal protein S18 acetylase RimI-like enzyme